MTWRNRPWTVPVIFLACVSCAALVAQGPFDRLEAESAEFRGGHDDAPPAGTWPGLVEKTRVVQELVAQRLTLAEAVARFQAIEARGPALWSVPAAEESGHPRNERSARQVLAWAEGQVQHRPGGQTVLARLADELRTYLDGPASAGRRETP